MLINDHVIYHLVWWYDHHANMGIISKDFMKSNSWPWVTMMYKTNRNSDTDQDEDFDSVDGEWWLIMVNHGWLWFIMD